MHLPGSIKGCRDAGSVRPALTESFFIRLFLLCFFDLTRKYPNKIIVIGEMYETISMLIELNMSPIRLYSPVKKPYLNRKYARANLSTTSVNNQNYACQRNIIPFLNTVIAEPIKSSRHCVKIINTFSGLTSQFYALFQNLCSTSQKIAIHYP